MRENPRKAEWAVTKVLTFCPQIPEKSTLIAIAWHLNYESQTAWPGRELIARESGNSVRTVRRHLKTLESLGLIVVQRGGHGRKDPNVYRIPCCSLTLDELELLTGVSGHQLLLPYVHPERSGVVVAKDFWAKHGDAPDRVVHTNSFLPLGGQNGQLRGTEWPEKGDKMTPKQDITLFEQPAEPVFVELTGESKYLQKESLKYWDSQKGK